MHKAEAVFADRFAAHSAVLVNVSYSAFQTIPSLADVAIIKPILWEIVFAKSANHATPADVFTALRGLHLATHAKDAAFVAVALRFLFFFRGPERLVTSEAEAQTALTTMRVPVVREDLFCILFPHSALCQCHRAARLHLFASQTWFDAVPAHHFLARLAFLQIRLRPTLHTTTQFVHPSFFFAKK